MDLAKDEELEKCLHGKTQNANESFNGKIWDRLPKTTYVSLSTLKFGVYDAVGNFNIGMKSSIMIYEKLNMVPGIHTIRGANEINKLRLSFSSYRAIPHNKLRRQLLRARKIKKNDKVMEKEGPLYGAGCY